MFLLLTWNTLYRLSGDFQEPGTVQFVVGHNNFHGVTLKLYNELQMERLWTGNMLYLVNEKKRIENHMRPKGNFFTVEAQNSYLGIWKTSIKAE